MKKKLGLGWKEFLRILQDGLEHYFYFDARRVDVRMPKNNKEFWIFDWTTSTQDRLDRVDMVSHHQESVVSCADSDEDHMPFEFEFRRIRR